MLKLFVIDSHCHLSFFEGLDEVFAGCKNVGVSEILNVNLDLKNVKIFGENSFGIKVHQSIGVHPLEISKITELELKSLLEENQNKVVAFGETGLDLYHAENKFQQLDYLNIHLEMCEKYGKTCIIHSRACDVDDVLFQVKKYGVRFVFHCFTFGKSEAKKIVEMGGYISISGIVTFKNVEEMCGVVEWLPGDFLLVETDSPYLAPVPYRGKKCLPHFVIKTAQKISEIRRISMLDLDFMIKNNFYKCFNLI